jgi:hypothetical protein
VDGVVAVGRTIGWGRAVGVGIGAATDTVAVAVGVLVGITAGTNVGVETLTLLFRDTFIRVVLLA